MHRLTQVLGLALILAAAACVAPPADALRGGTKATKDGGNDAALSGDPADLAGEPATGDPDLSNADPGDLAGSDLGGACNLACDTATTNGCVGGVCVCKTGYVAQAGNMTACVDVNECATSNGGCAPAAEATCTNTPGSRTCMCKPGYTGNGLTCTDNNECATNNGGCASATIATCTNTPGSRTCMCKPGYTGTGLACADVNECQTGNGSCGTNAECSNTIGSRTCACPPAYAGDPYVSCELVECGSEWEMMGTFSCDAGNSEHQEICGCHPPGWDLGFWLDLGGGCYTHFTGAACCGESWPSQGVFDCRGGVQWQRICGCHPPGWNLGFWVDLGGGCYEHMTGSSC